MRSTHYPCILTVDNPQPLSTPLTSYALQINRGGLRSGNHIKQRIKSKYLQHYKDKLNIKSIVKVKPPCADYLARLTTKQLDDYIQLQRNRARKHIHKRTFTESCQLELDVMNFTHTKIYRSSFLAKLNKVVGEQHSQQKKNQEYTQINYFFNDLPVSKQSKNAIFGKKVRKVERNQEDTTAEKSVASIKDSLVGVDLDDSEDSTRYKNDSKARTKRSESESTQIQWFDGLSSRLLRKQQPKPQPIIRGMDMDKVMNRSLHSKFRVKPYNN